VRRVKIIVEKHPDGYVEALEIDPPVLEAFVAEAQLDG
jgi:hypothetical protein